MSFRDEGGFVGEHDRTSGERLPDHISAKWQDIERLIHGIIATYKNVEETGFNAVFSSCKNSF